MPSPLTPHPSPSRSEAHSPRAADPYWEDLPGVVSLVNGSSVLTTSLDLRPYLPTGRETLWLPAGVYECTKREEEWTSSTIAISKPYIGAGDDSLTIRVQRCPAIPAINSLLPLVETCYS